MNASDHTASPSLVRGLKQVAVFGGALTLLGLFVAPERVWIGYLIGFVYVVGLALAGGLFLSVLHLSGARWATALRRVPEALTNAMPLAGLLGLGLLFGTHRLYEWSHLDVVANDELLLHKSSYLNVWGFSLRLVAAFALWIWLSRRLVARSRAQEASPTPAACRSVQRTSALFMAVLAITLSLVSVDWIQSLEPHWFSTIYALVILSGFGCAGIAACIVIAIALRRSGPFARVLTPNHLDDMGKIALGLTLFWAYIWYCQYMLIWYSNIPEETGYFLLRGEGIWPLLTRVNLCLNWAVPFAVLMSKRARRSESVIARVAILMLAAHVLDLFLLIAPPLMDSTPIVGVWILAPIVMALALGALAVLRGLEHGSVGPQTNMHPTQNVPSPINDALQA